MATLNGTAISKSGFTTFKDAIFAFHGLVEGDIGFVYSDGVDVPTIGVGLALIERGKNGWIPRDGYQDLLKQVGITDAQIAELTPKLQQAQTWLNTKTGSNPFSNTQNVLSWTITKGGGNSRSPGSGLAFCLSS